MNHFSDIIAMLPAWRLKDVALFTVLVSFGLLLIVSLVTALFLKPNYEIREHREQRLS